MVGIFGGLTSLWVSLIVAASGLVFVGYLSKKILSKDEGTDRMKEISGEIHKGAMAFLSREYKSIAFFVFLVAMILFIFVAKKTALAFIVGAVCSILAGWIGMQIATRSNARTAQAASKSFNEALGVAFPGGAVMGISVVSVGLFGFLSVLLYFIFLSGKADLAAKITEAVQSIVGFSLGASSVALFARVGGGIYTKAADVGADLVGKVEAGIPEDDPRNPAVIADNVGDNVGDVAGMGADLFESYIGAIISALVIAVAPNPLIDINGGLLAILISAWGIIAAAVGVYFVRTDEKTDPQAALRTGMLVTAALLLVGAFFLTKVWYGNIFAFWATLVGLVAGLIVGFAAEYYTSGKVVQEIAKAATTGAATCIIHGFAVSLKSTAIPVIAIAAATVLAYKFAGIFGVALSAIGMLSITGMTVAVDAYGPIADNAAGIAEMAHMGSEVRKRAERLDAVGNTTAAIGKGFAIGSAALTALALFTAYSQTVGINIINALSAKVVAGMFIGGMVPFVFCAYTMLAVGRAAFSVVEEVRRQFKEIPGLMEGKVMPDSAKCVDITTKGALKEMILPGVMAVALPIIVGTALGADGLGGFLVGSLVAGVPLAILLANAGGAWDNAKKYVEEGNLGGKGSDVHKATVIGDTIGDPFKDTSGPSLNILLKLMSVVALVFAPIIIKLNVYFLGMLK
ncbi:MAG: sodium-translocating pyrophosphatase [Elusimicrobia bacterium HGW-Elusimicrobia-1]|jgi:K(+)-stimulated pyrophosphate-energized sodium pump|nr:MAG: sodium-translocating pyrophosphatase [Elusimicrobia bacterium HGW-Elusimicrobia-1]